MDVTTDGSCHCMHAGAATKAAHNKGAMQSSRKLVLLAQFFALLIGLVSGPGGSAFSAQELLTKIEPPLGVRLGMGYDTAVLGPSKAGQVCVTFDPNKTQDARDGGSKNSHESVKKFSEIAKILNVSAMAQFSTVTKQYEANSLLNMVDKTEIRQDSETEVYYTYRTNNSVLLLTEHISLKPEYKELLKKGPKGRDEFRAKCGNAFVIGEQTGAYYYGTHYKSEETTQSLSKLAFDFEFSYRGGFNAKADVNYVNSLTKNTSEKVKKVADFSTDPKRPPAKNAEEIEANWQGFDPSTANPKLINTYLAPYTVVGGALPEGLLSGTSTDDGIEILLDALWELRSLLNLSRPVLKEPETFALGLPGGSIRNARLEHIRKIHAQWDNEFQTLRAATKACLEDFDTKCKELATQYTSNPPIARRAELPKKYRDNCYRAIHIRQNGEPDGNYIIPLSNGPHKGDAEVGGGPVLLTAALTVRKDARQLKTGASGFSVGRRSGYYGWPRRARPCKTPRSISTCSACSRRGP